MPFALRCAFFLALSFALGPLLVAQAPSPSINVTSTVPGVAYVGETLTLSVDFPQSAGPFDVVVNENYYWNQFPIFYNFGLLENTFTTTVSAGQTFTYTATTPAQSALLIDVYDQSTGIWYNWVEIIDLVDPLTLDYLGLSYPSGSPACPGTDVQLTLSLYGEPPFTVTWTDGVVATYQAADILSWFTLDSPLRWVVVRTDVTTPSPPPPGGVWSTGIQSVTDAHGTTISTGALANANVSYTTAHLQDASGAYCLGDDLVLTVDLGGVSPWEVTWSDGLVESNILSSPHTRTINLDTLGSHYIGITGVSNSATCATFATGGFNYSVYEVTAGVSGSNVGCPGDTAPLQVTIQGGVPPYSLTWSDGLVESGIMSPSHIRNVTIPPGSTTYGITSVSDSAGCTGTGTLAATLTGIQVSAAVNGGAAICPGESTTLQVDITSNGPGPWGVTWSDGHFENVATTPYIRTVSPAAGTHVYTVTSITEGLCSGTSSGSATVVVHPPVSAVVSGGSTLNAGEVGVIFVTLTGTPPFNVVWNDGFSEIATSLSYSRSVQPTVTTTYTIASVTDANCPPVAGTGSAAFNVIQPTYTLSAPSRVPFGESATFSVAVSGGTSPYTITWSDGLADSQAGPVLTRTTYLPGPLTLSVAQIVDANGIVVNGSGSATVLTDAPPVFEGHMWSVTPYAQELRRVDLATGATIATTTLAAPAFLGVPHIHGLVRHPTLGTIYTVLWDGIDSWLATVDLGNSSATLIGVVGADIRALAIDDTGGIWGLDFTGVLHSINGTNGASTAVSILVPGGVALAVALSWNPADRRLHFGFGAGGTEVYGIVDPTTGQPILRPRASFAIDGLKSLTHVNADNLVGVDSQSQLHLSTGRNGYTWPLGTLDHVSSGILADDDAWMTLLGTGGDVQLLAGKNGGPVTPDARLYMQPGDTLDYFINTPTGSYTGSPGGLAVQLYATDSAPPYAWYVDPFVHLQFPTAFFVDSISALDTTGAFFSFSVPQILSGFTIRMQAYTLSIASWNGIYETTDVIDVITL